MFYPFIVSIHCPFIIRLIIVYPFVVNCLFMYLALIMHWIQLLSIYHPLIIHLLPIYHHILSCARPFVIDVLAIYFPCIFHSVVIVSSICHSYIVQYFFLLLPYIISFPSIKFHISVQMSRYYPLFSHYIQLLSIWLYALSMYHPCFIHIRILSLFYQLFIHVLSIGNPSSKMFKVEKRQCEIPPPTKGQRLGPKARAAFFSIDST